MSLLSDVLTTGTFTANTFHYCICTILQTDA